MLEAKVGAGTGDRRVLFSEEQVEQAAEAVNRARTTTKVAILTTISTATPCTEVVQKDIEIQPGFEPGSSEFRSDALTNEPLELCRGIGAEDRWHLSIRHSSILRLDLS